MSAGLVTGFAGLAFLMKCGDTCDALTVFETEDTVPWHEAPGSWQWSGQMAIASAALVAVLAALVFAARRRYRSATIAGALALVCLET